MAKKVNEFTKEELLIILSWGIDRVEAVGKSEFDWEGSASVYSKINSMIDNYCECQHKNIVTGAYPRSNPPKKCDNCGVLYYE